MSLPHKRMLLMQIFVLFFMATVILTHGSTISPTTIPNRLSYVCNTSGVMDVTKPEGFDLFVVNGTGCTETPTTNRHFILQNCKNKIQTIAVTHNSFIGGKLPMFRLLCNDTKYTVVLNSLNMSFTDPSPTPIPKNISHSTEMSLEIRKGNISVTSAVIGEKLALVIKAPSGLDISPKVCQAMSETKHHDIWKAESSLSCSVEPDVIETTWKKTNTTDTEEYSITMYAFRFKDSSTITISCTIDVCGSGVTGCEEVCVTGSGGAKRRRKRNASNRNGKKVNKNLEAQLRVYDTISDDRSMSGAGKLISPYVSVMFGILLLKKQLW